MTARIRIGLAITLCALVLACEREERRLNSQQPKGPQQMVTQIRNTLERGSPRALSSVQPVRASATGFISVTAPFTSVAMTASPMLRSVVISDARAKTSRA